MTLNMPAPEDGARAERRRQIVEDIITDALIYAELYFITKRTMEQGK